MTNTIWNRDPLYGMDPFIGLSFSSAISIYRESRYSKEAPLQQHNYVMAPGDLTRSHGWLLGIFAPPCRLLTMSYLQWNWTHGRVPCATHNTK